MSFKAALLPPGSPEHRQTVIETWKRALETAFQSVEFPTQPFVLEAKSIRMDGGVATIRYDNPTGEVALLRSLVKQAYQNVRQEASKMEAIPRAALTYSFNSPNIVHSTFVRMAGLTHPRTASIAVRNYHWKPRNVSVTGLSLALEDRPYMHVPRDEDHILVSYSFRPH